MKILLAVLFLAFLPGQEQAPPTDPWQEARLEAIDLERLNLLRVDLPVGNVVGFDVEWSGGWSGSGRTKYRTRADGYDGIRLVGQGRHLTRIVPTATSGGSTVLLGNDAGVVVLENLTVVCDTVGKGKGIHAGTDRTYGNGFLRGNNALVLRNVHLRAPPPAEGRRHSAVWGAATYNFDIDWEDVTVDCLYTAEHGLYVHGYSKRGVRFVKVEILAVGAEGLKITNRPWEVWNAWGARVYVADSIFRNWKQPWSWQGGAGMTLQGAGFRTALVERCAFFGSGVGRSYALMVDDGLSTIRTLEENRQRYYDHRGVAGGAGAANGWIAVRRSGFHGLGGAVGVPMIRIGTTYPGLFPHSVARGLWLKECGLYGKNTRVAVSGLIAPDLLLVEDCNTEPIRLFSERHGFDTEHETTISGTGKAASLGAPLSN